MTQQWQSFRPEKRQDAKSINEVDSRLNRVRKLAHLLDSSFGLPGTSVRFGLDSLLGLIPGVGDIAGALLSGYIVYEGLRLRAPKRLLMRMIGNIAVDSAIGAIPIAGDLFDVAWKANRRNLRLLNRHVKQNANDID